MKSKEKVVIRSTRSNRSQLLGDFSFVDGIKNALPGLISQESDGGRATALKAFLRDVVSRTASFAAPTTEMYATFEGSIFHDDEAESSGFTYIEIPLGIVDKLHAAFKKSGNESPEGAYSMTFTDDGGNVIQITDLIDFPVMVDERQVIFKTNFKEPFAQVTDNDDILCYYDTVSSKYYMRDAVRTVYHHATGFLPSEEVDNTIIAMMRRKYNSNSDTILGCISDQGCSKRYVTRNPIDYWADDEDTNPTIIYPYINNGISAPIDLSMHRNTILARLAAWYEANAAEYTTNPDSSRPAWVSYTKLFRTQLDNATLCDVGCRSIQSLQSGGFSADDLYSYAEDNYGQIDPHISDYIDEIKQIYELQGALYALRAVIRYFATSSSVVLDESGGIKFTDNSLYVTGKYLAGMVSGAISVLGTLASLIATAINPVVGAVVSMTTAVVSQIPKWIDQGAGVLNYGDYDCLATLDCFPYGGAQNDFTSAKRISFPKKDLNSPTSYIGKVLHFGDDLSALLDLTQGVPKVVYTPGALTIVASSVTSGRSGLRSNWTRVRTETHLTPSITSISYLRAYLKNKIIKCGLTDGGVIKDAYALVGNLGLAEIANCYQQESLLSAIDIKTLSAEDRDNLLRRSYAYASIYDALTRLCLSSFNTNSVLSLTNALVFVDESTTPYGALFGWVLNPNTRPLPDWEDILSPTPVGAAGYFGTNMFLYNKDNVPQDISHAYKMCCRQDLTQHTTPDGTYYVDSSEVSNDDLLSWSMFLPLYYDPTVVSKLYTCSYWSVYSINSINGFSVIPPRYDRASFWLNVVAGMIATAIVVAAAVVTTMKVKRKFREINAINNAKASSAWDDLTKDPSPENYKAYAKAAKKNNLFARFTGGTMLAKSGYWDDYPGDLDQADSVSLDDLINKVDDAYDLTEDVGKLIKPSFTP